MMGVGILSVSRAISKFYNDLWVWAAHNLSLGTWMGPKVSLSSLKPEKLNRIIDLHLEKLEDMILRIMNKLIYVIVIFKIHINSELNSLFNNSNNK